MNGDDDDDEIRGHMLTGQMLTPLSKKSDKCSQSHLNFRRRSSAGWTGRCTNDTADVMWNAHRVEFTRTDRVSALVRRNTTQIIMFKSSSTPAEVRVLSVSICPHTDDDDDDDKTTHISAAHGVSMRDD